MPRDTSISLGEHFAGFIAAQVQTGRYGSASDVVRPASAGGQQARVRALEAA